MNIRMPVIWQISDRLFGKVYDMNDLVGNNQDWDESTSSTVSFACPNEATEVTGDLLKAMTKL